MTPPIKDLLPRLTPILKNRHEKVQENCIDLVGRIADRGNYHDFYLNPKIILKNQKNFSMTKALTKD